MRDFSLQEIVTRYEEMEKEGHFDLVSHHYLYVHAYISECVCVYVCIVTRYEEMEKEGHSHAYPMLCVYIYMCVYTCISLQNTRRWRRKDILIWLFYIICMDMHTYPRLCVHIYMCVCACICYKILGDREGRPS